MGGLRILFSGLGSRVFLSILSPGYHHLSLLIKTHHHDGLGGDIEIIVYPAPSCPPVSQTGPRSCLWLHKL